MDSRNAQPVAANFLSKRPAPKGTDQTRMTDTAYVRTAAGWLFLVAISNVLCRRIVG
jgi:hypothetical protein